MMIQWRILFCIASVLIIQGETVGTKSLEKSEYLVGPSTDNDVFIECTDYTCVEKLDSMDHYDTNRFLRAQNFVNEPKVGIQSDETNAGRADGCNDENCIYESENLGPFSIRSDKRHDRMGFGLNNLDRNFRFRFRVSPDLSGLRIMEKKNPMKQKIINLPSLNVPLNPASGPVREIRLKHQVPSRKIRDEPERYLMWRKIAGK